MNADELLAKAAYLETRLAEGANEVGITDLVAWLKEVGKLLLAEYVEMHASRQHIERVIANIRDWVKVGEIDRAEREARRYDVNANYIGELLRARVDIIRARTDAINAKPLEVGRKQIAVLTERRDRYNTNRQRKAEVELVGWQREADAIWKNEPHLRKSEVAKKVKRNLKATQEATTIAKKLRSAS